MHWLNHIFKQMTESLFLKLHLRLDWRPKRQGTFHWRPSYVERDVIYVGGAQQQPDLTRHNGTAARCFEPWPPNLMCAFFSRSRQFTTPLPPVVLFEW